MLEPVTLKGAEKETYLQNLEKAFAKLSLVLGAADIDASLSEYVKMMSRTADLFRYHDGNKDPKENRGTYKELGIDKRNGFPDLEEVVLLSSKAASARNDLKRLGTTQEFADRAVGILLNYDASDENLRELRKINETVRHINLLIRLQNRDYADLPEGTSSKILQIDLIGETAEGEHFKMFYAKWDLTKHFFSAYSLLVDDDKEKYMIVGPEKPGHIFRDTVSDPWKESDEVRRILAGSFGMHPQHYFQAFNDLEGLHPQKLCYLGIERFESKHANKHFTDALSTNPDSAILVASVITLKGKEEVGKGKTRQTTFDQIRDTAAKIYVVCSEDVKAGVIEYYTHNKNVDFEIIPF